MVVDECWTKFSERQDLAQDVSYLALFLALAIIPTRETKTLFGCRRSVILLAAAEI